MTAHEDLTPKHHLAGPSDFSFGMAATVAFTVAGLWPLLRHRPVRFWAFSLAGAFLAAALTKPRILHPINSAWMKLAMLINRLVTLILTVVLFFGVVTPLAYVFRVRRRDALRLRRDPEATTFWIERLPPGPSPQSMNRQF